MTALLCAVAVAAILAADYFGATSQGGLVRPNVLLLVMDTTRADRCSFQGYGRPTTPRLAEFAKDAVVFREAWSPGGWTGPAHGALFTGLRPENHRFHDGDRNYLGTEFATLAESLEGAGYSTACFTGNEWIAPEFGMTQGFEKFEPCFLRPDGPVPQARRTHASAADWARHEAGAGRPFFLFVNDMEPHLRYAPSEKDQTRFLRGDPTLEEIAAARGIDVPEITAFALGAKEFTPRQIGILSDLYDAEIAGLDREIGSFLDRFRELGLLDSTVVVIAGDHGELLGQHHMIEHGHSLSRAARHVPLLVRYPGSFDGGRSVDALVRLEDVPPTILELCGLSAPADIDGVSLTHDLEGRLSIAVQGPFPGRRAQVEALVPGADPTPYLLGLEAVFDGRFHLVRFSDGRRQLFDVSRDPGETEDLASREPDVVDRLGAFFPASR